MSSETFECVFAEQLKLLNIFFLFSLITHIVIAEVLFIDESFYHPTLLAPNRFIATDFSVRDPSEKTYQIIIALIFYNTFRLEP